MNPLMQATATSIALGFVTGGNRLKRWYAFLHVLAESEISPMLRLRVEPSDIVQETMIEVFTTHDQFCGQTERELAEWLRRILQHNVRDAVRRWRCQKRDVAREVSLEASRHDSLAPLADFFTADGATPSHQMMATEQILELSQAITRLPVDQREAIVRHYLQGQTIAQLAVHFQRHPSAIAGLLHRGLKKLRDALT